MVGNKEGDVFSGWVLVWILEVLFVGVKWFNISVISVFGFIMNWDFFLSFNGVIKEYRIVYKEIKMSLGNYIVEFLFVFLSIFIIFFSGLKFYLNYEVYL